MLKNIFFKDLILVVWKYAQMHQNKSLITPDGKKKFLVVCKYAQIYQNTPLTTPDVQKYLFWKKNSGGLDVGENASKHVFNHSRC